MNNKLFFLILEFYLINSINCQAVITWSFGSYLFPINKSLEFEVTVLSPTKPGIYPVVFFLTGYTGLFPEIVYKELLTEISTFEKQNRIIISFDKFGMIHLPIKEETLFEMTLNWTIDNLKGIFNCNKTPDIIKSKVFPSIDSNGYTIMSHSAGAHPTCSYVAKHCNQIKKIVWLDPVDGYDPTEIVKEFCTNPPQQLPFQVPTLIISTGLDNFPPSPVQGACKFFLNY